MVHTGRHSHCTPFPQQKPFSLHQAEILRLCGDETTGAGQQKSAVPKQARSPSQSSAQPLLHVTAPCHCRQRQSLSLLIPVPLGHPLVEKPDISRNQKRQGVQKQKEQHQSRRAMRGQDHSRWPASYEVSEFVVLKCKYELLNVNTPQTCAKQPISTDCSLGIQEITFLFDNSKEEKLQEQMWTQKQTEVTKICGLCMGRCWAIIKLEKKFFYGAE